MPTVVDIPDVGEVEFPDSMDESAIRDTIQTKILKRPSAPVAPVESAPVAPVKPTPVAPSVPQSIDLTEGKSLNAYTGAVEDTAARDAQLKSDLGFERAVKSLRFQDQPKEKPIFPETVNPVAAFGSKVVSEGILKPVAGVGEFLGDTFVSPVRATFAEAKNPADQERLDQLREEIKRRETEIDSETNGAKRAQLAQAWAVDAQKLKSEEESLVVGKRADTVSGKIAGLAETADIVAENALGVPGALARAGGTVTSFLLPGQLAGGGTRALGVAGAQAAANAEVTARTQALNAGATEEEAKNAGLAAAGKALVTLPAYLAIGRAVAGATGKVLENAGRATQVAAQTLTATAANVATGAVLRKIEGGAAAPDLEQFAADALWGIVHGVGVNAEAKAKAAEALRAKGVPEEQINNPDTPPTEPPATAKPPTEPPTPVVEAKVEPADLSQPLKADPEAADAVVNTAAAVGPATKQAAELISGRVPETTTTTENAQQNTETTQPDGGVRPRGELPEVPAEVSREGVQPSGQRAVETPAPTEGEVTPTGETSPERNLGPGAANIEEPLNTFTTSNKEAVVNAERAARELDPVIKEARVTNAESVDRAEAILENDPRRGEAIVERLRTNPQERTISLEDSAVLLVERTKLLTERATEEQRINDPNSTPEEVAQANERYDLIEGKLDALDQAAQDARSTWGRFGQLWQRSMRSDWTLQAMETRARRAKGGPLTPEETAQIAKESEAINKAQNELDTQEATADETQSIKAAEAVIAEEKRYHPNVLKYAEKVVSRWEEEAIAARKELREAMGYASANPFPVKVAGALFKMARAKIARGLLNAADFTSSVVAEFGEGVRQFIQPAWEKAMKFVGNLDETKVRKKSPKQVEKERVAGEEAKGTEAGIRALVEGGAKDISTLAGKVKQLAKKYIQAGETTVEGLQTKLHDFFQPLFPDVSPRQLRDLFSDYGKSKAAPTDPLKIAQAQRRTEAQKLSALEDLIAKKAALATGPRRVEQSERARALQKQINEKKKELGIVDGDPATRLKSALEAMETRTQNRINDLRFEIARGERLVKSKTAPPTSEKLDALRAELATVQAEHNAVFGKRELTDQQRLDAAIAAATRAEKQAAAELVNARNGIFEKPATKGVPRSAELEAIRARTEALREERKALQKAANPPLSDAQKALDSALVAKERWEQLLAGEIAPAKKLPREALTQLEEDARLEVASMKELAAQLRQQKNAPTEADRVQEALNRALAERERLQGVLSGEIPAETKQPKEALSQMEEDVRLEIASLRELQARLQREARPKADPEAVKEEATIKALEKAAAEYERRLNEADFAGKGKTQTADTQKVAAARALRDAAKTAFEAARKATIPTRSPEEIAIQTRKAQISRQLADIAERMAKEDFAPRAKKPALDVSKDPEAVRLKGELEAAKAEFQKRKHAYLLARENVAQKVWRGIKDVSRGTRNILGSVDLSAPRQALAAVRAHPIIGIKNTKELFSGFFSEKKAQEHYNKIQLRPNAKSGAYKEMGLAITPLDEVNFSKTEENARSSVEDWANLNLKKGNLLVRAAKAPLKLGGTLLRMSNRAFISYLNETRADLADFLLRVNFKDRAPTKEEMKAMGDLVNTMTGRGLTRGAGELANTLLYSPNFLVARLKNLSGFHIWRPGATARTRKIAAKETFKQLVTWYAIYRAVQLFSDKKEKDITSSDFAKLVDGKTRVDYTGGEAALITLGARLAQALNNTIKGKKQDRNMNSELLRQYRYKASPVMGAAVDWITGKTVMGEPTTLKGTLARAYTPMAWQDVKELAREHSIPKTIWLQIQNLLGAGVNTYDAEKKR